MISCLFFSSRQFIPHQKGKGEKENNKNRNREREKGGKDRRREGHRDGGEEDGGEDVGEEDSVTTCAVSFTEPMWCHLCCRHVKHVRRKHCLPLMPFGRDFRRPESGKDWREGGETERIWKRMQVILLTQKVGFSAFPILNYLLWVLLHQEMQAQ